MIKYENGTKDVFNIENNANNSSNQQSEKTNSRNNNKNKYKQKGFSNITEVNIGLVGYDYANQNDIDRSIYYIGIQTINGYQFCSLLNTGIGIGFDNYKYDNFIPLFLDIRSNFIKGIISPFIVCDIGYSFLVTKNTYTIYNNTGYSIYNGVITYYYDKYTYNTNKGGLMINPCIGVKFFVSSKTAINLSIGLHIQKYSFESTFESTSIFNESTITDSYGYKSRIIIKLGVTF